MHPFQILILCEESQKVATAFRKRGFEAYSNDVVECSGGHSEYHLQMDCFAALELKKWDMVIGFPPCTFLTYVANKWYRPEYNIQLDLFKGNYTREDKRKEAFTFFMEIANWDVPFLALENPVGIVQKWWRKPDQVIHPYYFGDPFKKRTCLWLKNLPKLEFTNVLPEPKPLYRLSTSGKPIQWVESLGRSKDRSKLRSTTFDGIAEAMADQWGNHLINKLELIKK